MRSGHRRTLIRLYDWLLRLYPRQYRDTWGARMHATFEQRARDTEGARPVERWRFAAREFGNLATTLLRERYAMVQRHVATETHLRNAPGDLAQDVRFGLRALRSTPTFTVVALIALTLGIGAASAMFSVVDAVLLRPLPYPDAARVVQVWETSGDWLRNAGAPANFIDWRAASTSFDSFAAFSGTTFTLTGEKQEPVRLSGTAVSGDFFAVFRVAPRLGRAVEPRDDTVAAADVVVLSHSLWVQRYGADPQIVGTDILLDGRPHMVIGVMPSSFVYPTSGGSFWVPLAFDDAQEQLRNWRYLGMVGRLTDTATPALALSELQTIAARLAREYPVADEGVSAYLLPLREEMLGDVRLTLLAASGAIGVVLLIACANVATLMLTRATARRSEVAVRAALGAGRWRIVRQMAVESLLLALGAGALGVVMGGWGVDLLATLVPASLPLEAAPQLDVRFVGFALILSLLTSAVFGLFPALHATRSDLAAILRGGRATTTRNAHKLRATFVIAQVALAVTVLIGAGLMLRSFSSLMAEDLGFDPHNALSLRLGLGAERYDDAVTRLRFYDELLAGARALPGVKHAALTTSVPLGMSGGALIYTPEGQATQPQDATTRVVSDDYFAALGVDLQGRDFTPSDGADSMPVIIVGRELARRAWPDGDAIGKRLKLGNENSGDPWRTVIGVADDVRQWSLELPPRPAIYLPLHQLPDTFAPQDLVLETAGDPLALADPARRLVTAIDAEVPVAARTLQDMVGSAAATRRFNMELFGAFALVALTLAAIGLYGVIACVVGHRTHEIGIRMALGARAHSVVALMLRQGMALVTAGIVLGLLGGLGAARALQSLLYGIEGFDKPTFVLVPFLLVLVGGAATLVPSRRASRVPPVIALRRD